MWIFKVKTKSQGTVYIMAGNCEIARIIANVNKIELESTKELHMMNTTSGYDVQSDDKVYLSDRAKGVTVLFKGLSVATGLKWEPKKEWRGGKL